MSEAAVKGRWQPQEASELRRRALLPVAPAWAWDDLMCAPHYMQALETLSLL